MDAYVPQTTKAFLFTDIEGSTKLWESEPGLASEAIARHDALLRPILTARGHVFKAIGDAYCVAFPTVYDALESAVTAQKAIVAESWPGGSSLRVRMAVHAGAAECRDNDYFGQTLNRISRILSTGHGGQVLMSDVAFGLCRDALPEGIEVKQLGEHRLRDLGRPEFIYQVWSEGLPDQFPPLRSLNTYANNLPLQVTSFVGREDEVAKLYALLQAQNLVTIIGSGGCGKTRLSLQTAADLLDVFPDGAWFVELASTADPSSVPDTVANALGLRETPGRDAMDTLTEYLSSRNLLLVIDNCEHVLDATAKVVDRILRACPNVHMLATSREPLGISGEHPLRIRSLTVPHTFENQVAEALSQYESARLFINRAQVARPDFQVTNDNAPAIAELCYRLDGIPLAIELAAARLRSMSAEEVLKRLDDMFRILVGGSRTSLPRHQTLYAMIDWSYQLLSLEERTLLQRLTVFAGGWTLDMAEEICAGEALEGADVLNCLTGLVDRSIVDVYGPLDAPRYRLLEAIRQFGIKRLQESTFEQEARRRHYEWFRRFAKVQSAHLEGLGDHEALLAVKQDYANILASLEWGFCQIELAEDLSEYCRFLSTFWESSAQYRQGIIISERAIAMLREAGATRTHHALTAKARMLARLGDYSTALPLLRAAEATAKAESDLVVYVWCKHYEGACLHQTGSLEEAADALREGYKVASELGLAYWKISCANGLGLTASSLGRSEEGLDYLEHAMLLTRETGSRLRLTLTLNNLGVLYRDAGRLDDAMRAHEEGLEICQNLGLVAHKIFHEANLAAVLWMQGHVELACRYGVSSLKASFDAEDVHRACAIVRDASAIASICEDWEPAALMIGATNEQSNQLGVVMDEPDQVRYGPRADAVRDALGEPTYSRLATEGASWPWDKAVEYTLAFLHRWGDPAGDLSG